MITPSRRAALLAPLAFALTAPSAHAADPQANCKIALAAQFAVIMEGPRASVAVSFNGQPSRVWLDSGAFYNLMPKARAVALGLHTEPLNGMTVSGIGGSFAPQLAKVRDFGIVGVTLHNILFVVGGSDSGNGFLGANFLGIWDTEFDLAHGAVKLFKVHGCDKMSLAYWSGGMAVGEARLLRGDNAHDYHIYVEVMVNGHPMRAMLDTGAPTTLIGAHAAARAGIDLTSPKVIASAKMTGVGNHARQSWIAHTQTISIGGEDIQNSPIRVIDDADDDRGHDMLLGVDFLMSHHLFVSQSQRKMYLTYNGGAIFSSSTEGELGHLETRSQNMGGPEKTAEPTSADAFAGRGSARLGRGDVTGAIADFSAALALAPTRADILATRASAYTHSHHPDLAARDIDAGLAIAPSDHRLLTQRARLRLARGDTSGALADTNAAAAAAPKGALDAMALVVLYQRLGQAERALALLDPIIALHHDDSSYPELLGARSWNRALANADLDRALKDSNTALHKAGTTAALLNTRALVELRRHDAPAAAADTTAALAQSPKLASALFIRALAYQAQGDGAKAHTDLAAARSIQPKIEAYFAPYALAASEAATAHTPAQTPAQTPASSAENIDE